MSYVDFLIRGAIDSKGNARHWFRYLRKIIKNNQIVLSDKEIEKLLNNDTLSMFQKITLERATSINSPTFNYVSSLNKAAKLKFYNTLRSDINAQR